MRALRKSHTILFRDTCGKMVDIETYIAFIFLVFRFSLTHILSEPTPKWTGENGRMSDQLAKRLCDSESSMYSTVCFICGPTPFNDLCSKLLSIAGFSNDHLHLFRG